MTTPSDERRATLVSRLSEVVTQATLDGYLRVRAEDVVDALRALEQFREQRDTFRAVAADLGSTVQGVVDALGIRRDAERDTVLAALAARLSPAGTPHDADPLLAFLAPDVWWHPSDQLYMHADIPVHRLGEHDMPPEGSLLLSVARPVSGSGHIPGEQP